MVITNRTQTKDHMLRWNNVPQSYCISRSSGNWTAELIAIWCKHRALGVNSLRSSKSMACWRATDDGHGWDACIVMHGAVAGGIANTNLWHTQAANLLWLNSNNKLPTHMHKHNILLVAVDQWKILLQNQSTVSRLQVGWYGHTTGHLESTPTLLA